MVVVVVVSSGGRGSQHRYIAKDKPKRAPMAFGVRDLMRWRDDYDSLRVGAVVHRLTRCASALDMARWARGCTNRPSRASIVQVW